MANRITAYLRNNVLGLIAIFIAAARNPAKKALKSGKKVTAKITVAVTDAAGGSSSEKRTVKLKP